MGRRATPLDESMGMELYDLLVKYCGESNVIPSPYSFWSKILKDQQGYPISRGGFEHWLMRLQIPQSPGETPLIERTETGAYRLRDVKVVRK